MSTTPSPTNSDRPYEATLRDALTQHFNLDEFRSLCLDLGVEYEELGGDTRSRKAQELVLFCRRDGRLAELTAAMQRVRPSLMLPPAPPPSPAPSAYGPNHPPPETVAEAVFRAVWARDGALIEHRAPSPLWAQVDWRRAGQVYTDRVVRLHGTTRVIGQPKPMPLDDLYTEVHLLDKPTAWRRFTVEQLLEEFTKGNGEYLGGERRDGLEFVTELGEGVQRPWLFVLGKPGAGKTTFLKHIALQAVQQRLGEAQRIPFFISLRDLADSEQGIAELIMGQLKPCRLPHPLAFVEALLEGGHSILLFDGLDEVPQGDKQQVTLLRTLNRFIEQYDANQYLVTCRTAANEYRLNGFTYAEIADFTKEQVLQFVSKWFRKDVVAHDLFYRELVKREHRGFRELVRVPLLLAMLCLAFEELRGFPKPQTQLYSEVLEVLLSKWDSDRGVERDAYYQNLSVQQRKELLAQIAHHTFAKGEIFIAQDVLEREIVAWSTRVLGMSIEQSSAREIIKAIEMQHGVLVERARYLYSFAHLTFQEYYTAYHLVNFSGNSAVNKLVQYCADPRWREVFLMVAALLPVANDFFEEWLGQLDKMAMANPNTQALLYWLNYRAISNKFHASMGARRAIYLVANFTIVLGCEPTFTRWIYKDLTETSGELARTDTPWLAFHFAQQEVMRLRDKFGGDGFLQFRIGDYDSLTLTNFQLNYSHYPDGYYSNFGEAITDTISNLNNALQNEYLKGDERDAVLDFTLSVASMLAYFVTGSYEHLRIVRSLLDQSLSRAISLAQQLNLIQLHGRLLEISVPQKANTQQWIALSKELQDLLWLQRKIPKFHEWKVADLNFLQDYVASARFLLECLEVANLPTADKAAIQDRLLRPPTAAPGTG